MIVFNTIYPSFYRTFRDYTINICPKFAPTISFLISNIPIMFNKVSLQFVAKRYFAIQRPSGGSLLTKPKIRTPVSSSNNPSHQNQSSLYPTHPNQPPPQLNQHYPQQYHPQGQPPHHYPPQNYAPGQMPQQYHPHGQMPQQYQQQQQQPQSLGGTIGSGILDGVTFGVGSSLAHRAVDGIMGPRTMQVEHVQGGSPVGTAPVGDFQQQMPQDNWQSQPPPDWDQSQPQWNQQDFNSQPMQDFGESPEVGGGGGDGESGGFGGFFGSFFNSD